jgi:hypothetical protein
MSMVKQESCRWNDFAVEVSKFAYAVCHFSDLSVWWILENPESLFIPLRMAFYFEMKDAILIM